MIIATVIKMQENLEPLSVAARLFMVASMGLLLKTLSRTAYVHAFLWLPATAAHELAHVLTGVLLRAKPVGLSLWPRRVPGTDRVILGHVQFANLSWWRKLPVATAPLYLLLPLALWLVWYSLEVKSTGWVSIAYCYAALQSFAGSWPSSEDWALARTTIYVLLVVAALGALAYVSYLYLF